MTQRSYIGWSNVLRLVLVENVHPLKTKILSPFLTRYFNIVPDMGDKIERDLSIEFLLATKPLLSFVFFDLDLLISFILVMTLSLPSSAETLYSLPSKFKVKSIYRIFARICSVSNDSSDKTKNTFLRVA